MEEKYQLLLILVSLIVKLKVRFYQVMPLPVFGRAI